jgi:hypothetical protein
VIYDWSEILPGAIESLPPLHQELVLYVMAIPGKKRPSYTHAAKTWALGREQFDMELEFAFNAIRLYLKRFGLASMSDLEPQ